MKQVVICIFIFENIHLMEDVEKKSNLEAEIQEKGN